MDTGITANYEALWGNMTYASIPRLSKLHVYLTARCNMQCRHCWVEAGPFNRDHLTANRIVHQIDKAMLLGLNEMKVTGGEPLLFQKDTLAILEHAFHAGVNTRLETNCLTMNNDIVSRIREYGTVVTTSLDGSSATSHDMLRGAPGSFERVLEAIASLVDNGVQVDVVSCIHKNNLHEIYDIVSLCSDLGVGTLKFNFPSSYGRALSMDANSQLCSTQMIIETVRHVEKRNSLNCSIKLDFDVPRVFRNYPLSNPRCETLSLISILPDGRYSLCGIGITHRQLTFGNLDKEDIDIVWKASSTLMEMRYSLQQSARGVCGLCAEYASCYGHCIAYGFSKYFSLNGPHPLCQSAFEKGLFPKEKLRNEYSQLYK